MKQKIIEQRIIKVLSCGRERKFAAHPGDSTEIAELKTRKRECHVGLQNLHPAICGACVWFDQNKFDDGTGRAAVTDREIDASEADRLRMEYVVLNEVLVSMPVFTPLSVFRLNHREDHDG